MKCLCCGEKIDDSNLTWHNGCIKKFFNSDKIPEELIDIEVDKYAINMITNRYSVTGVQPKLSLTNGLISVSKKTLSLNSYILKPNTKEYPYIAICEHLAMLMAKECNINVVDFALIESNNDYMYITKRIDRNKDGKIHMEDFCQLSNKPTEEKYHSSYEQCAKIIDKYSKNRLLDKAEFFLRVIFSFIIGNSDMHLKNFSLIDNNGYVLSKQYDLLPVLLIYPADNEELALTLNGKKKNITKNDIYEFGITIGLNDITIRKMLDRLIKNISSLYYLIDDSLLPSDLKQNFKDLINNRLSRIKS